MKGEHRVNRSEGPPVEAAGTPACEWPGCPEVGLHRAPRSPRELRAYRWFCKDHARQYNSAWNYYKGMSAAEVEADVRRDTVWDRPTWPLGGSGNGRYYAADDLVDRMRILGEFVSSRDRPQRRVCPDTPEGKAMTVLGLEPPLSAQALKSRYKELAKLHHPDTNNGDKSAEEKIKKINEAYRTLLDSLGS